MSIPVRVPLQTSCPCPGTPHEEEWVDLAPRLGITAGAAAWAAINAAEPTNSEIEAAIGHAFLRHGIVAWSFTGEAEPDGRRPSVPITNETIADLLDWGSASEVAERANELYSEDLFRPLARRLSASSPSGPTGESTSATTDSGDTPPTPSKRSSRAATAGTPSGVPVP